MRNSFIIGSIIIVWVDIALLTIQALDIIGGNTTPWKVGLFGALAFSMGLLTTSTAWLWKMTRE